MLWKNQDGGEAGALKLQDMDIKNMDCIDPDNRISSDLQAMDDEKIHIIAMMGFIGRLQKAKIDTELSRVGLTVAQVEVLLYLLGHSGKGREITARELEQRFRVSNPTMSGILKRLEKKNIIERTQSSLDRRNKQICIKGDVNQLCRIVEDRIYLEKEKLFRDFTPEESTRLLQLLTKLLHNLEHDRNEE